MSPKRKTATESAKPERPKPSLATLAGHPHALRVSDVAFLLDCSERHIYELNARGKLRNMSGIGGALRFLPAELFRFINAPTGGEVA
jgi:hypothetical protein